MALALCTDLCALAYLEPALQKWPICKMTKNFGLLKWCSRQELAFKFLSFKQNQVIPDTQTHKKTKRQGVKSRCILKPKIQPSGSFHLPRSPHQTATAHLLAPIPRIDQHFLAVLGGGIFAAKSRRMNIQMSTCEVALLTS